MTSLDNKDAYVLGIDVGTTTVRGLVYNVKGEVVGEAHSSIEAVIPNPGWYEIDPDQLWEKVIKFIITELFVQLFVCYAIITTNQLLSKSAAKLMMNYLQTTMNRILKLSNSLPPSPYFQVCQVIRDCIHAADLSSSDISSMGISCQRATFTTWSAITGKNFHNFITWKDLRADKYVNMWNSSWTMRALRAGGKFLHWCTRMPR